MSTSVYFYGWNRATPGYEKEAGALFQEYVQYLGGLQQAGSIDSFETVILTAHGGDLNGFFLIRGEAEKLDALRRTEAFSTFLTKASFFIDGGGLITGVTGAGVLEQMALWTSHIPD